MVELPLSEKLYPPELKNFEKINTSVYSNSEKASYYVAKQIAELIKEKASKNEYAVLGLATGSSPIKVYDYLVRFHQNEGLHFNNVVTFNLDEYYPMNPHSFQSYVRFMNEHLFNHIDIDPKNIHIPDGTLDYEDIKAFCNDYEARIKSFGGIDIQLLGIGRTGHVGFNEPGSSIKSKTRLIRLDRITRLDAASDFFGEENVPSRAITMGVGTILSAKKIFLLAWGEAKAQVIKEAVEGEIKESIPASFLQTHQNCEFVIDNAAGNLLTRINSPWIIDECEWDDQLIKKAVIWLSEKVNKVILKLTNEDYNEYGMGNLIAEYDSAEAINLKVFNVLQHTITGWPGGKPEVDDSTRPERKSPFPKRSLIFSPHPDDDIISMGGTMMRLVDQGHDVFLAYQTSGNIAVFDDDVIRFLDFTKEAIKNEEASHEMSEMLKRITTELHNKKSGDVDSKEVQEFKALIRKGEAMAACRYSNIKDENVYFLNLPFYETGKVKKNPLSQEDIDIIYQLLNKIQPHQIFAAGDLSDPHGTHRVCLDAIFRAIERLKKEKAKWLKNTYVWLYRGAWQEWDIADIEMAVPIGPRELARKRNGIFKHQSQKDKAMFPGNDAREFWQRAEDRNHETAEKYDKLGLPEYEAVEAFVRWRF